ncbi:MAG: metallophosphoesterase [Myxococcales bacterium]|nr:metallophosphoesterase [Myxococcales bacterium]
MARFAALSLGIGLTLASCGEAASDDGSAGHAGSDAGTGTGGTTGSGGGAGMDGGAGVTCTPCTQTSDCGPGAACVQYAGSDFCGRSCEGGACGAGETCVDAITEDGAGVSACVPADGTCGSSGCGECPAGTSCDVIQGICVAPEPDGGDDGGPDEPDGGADGGPDQGSVGPNGGKVSGLYFAVVGDTRPKSNNATASYPTSKITKIYKGIESLNPRPQFVVANGDYMFASGHGPEGAKQLKLYMGARSNYSGTVFAVLGNHECSGDVNCAGVTNNNSYNSFLDNLIQPLGKTKPYYAISIDDSSGKWTAKLLITACNAWSPAQKTWLQNQLGKATTFTFVARHQQMGSDGPCNNEMDQMLKGAKYDMLLVGHIHTWNWDAGKRQLIEGVGGAPINTAGKNYGFATIRQLAGGSFRVRQYNWDDLSIAKSFTVP